MIKLTEVQGCEQGGECRYENEKEYILIEEVIYINPDHIVSFKESSGFYCRKSNKDKAIHVTEIISVKDIYFVKESIDQVIRLIRKE